MLLAWGFGNAWMLPWLAAAAAPILIHLWNRRRYREAPWAAMSFLLEALKKNSRRIQIEGWLLLALRTATVVLVVLALAEPFMEQTGLGRSGGARTHKVFVIDGSYSMDYKPGDRTLFARAKQLAAQIVEESTQGDGFSLILLASPSVSIVAAPALDRRAMIQEVESLKQTHGGGDLPSALALVEQSLELAESAGLERHEVLFLTDLGRSSWSPAAIARTGAADYRQRVARLAQQAALVVMDLGPPHAENLAVTALAMSEPLATVANRATFAVQVRNFAAQPKSAQPVQLLVDGRRVAERTVDLAAGGAAATSFSYQFDTSGDHVVEARAGGDLLEVDNHRYLALGVRDSLRALCIDGKPVGGQSSAAEFVALALNPQGRSSQRPLVTVEIAAETAILERDLAGYDCVFLCNVAQLTANEARVVDRYVERGGGLVIFLGDQVLPERYNRELGGESPARLLPADVESLVSEGTGAYRFDPLGYRHPALKAFEGREDSGLLTTPIYQYFRLKLAEGSGARVVLGFEGGDPAIVEESIGRGQSILVATDGSLSSVNPATGNPWTTLPAWPSFLPIVQELLSVAIAPKATERSATVGDALGGDMEAGRAKDSLQISTPDGLLPLFAEQDSGGRRWSWSATGRSGIYAVQYDVAGVDRTSYAVNVDTAESDLAKLDSSELPREFATSLQSADEASDSLALGRRGEMHLGFLWLVALMMLTETFLAWWLAHRRV